MDLDDLVEDLIPKKKLKKLKKKVKKKSILQLIIAFVLMIFGQKEEERREYKSKQRDDDYKRDDRSYESRKSEKRQSEESSRRPSKSKHSAESDPLRASLQQAQTYRMNIEAMALAADPDSIERTRLDILSQRVTEWTTNIEEIVERTLSQEEDPLLVEERKRVPAAIKRLEKQLASATDLSLREKLETTLANRRKQLEQLNRAANSRQIAELKVENTLAQLGIIYSQLHSGRYVREQSGYERLSAEISEEVHSLEDYLDALNEVHTSR